MVEAVEAEDVAGVEDGVEDVAEAEAVVAVEGVTTRRMMIERQDVKTGCAPF